jgi:hypothetical protein
MGKQRRKFETGFKQQIVSEIESGALSVNAASHKYQSPVASSVVGDDKPDNGVLRHHRWCGRKRLNVRTASSRKSWPSYIWKMPS